MGLLPNQLALAGALVSPGVHWKSFSFRPLEQEPTPNYFGYGGSLRLGYSWAQVLDMALFGSYTPSQLNGADDPMAASAVHRFAGVALGVRIKQSICRI